MTITRERCLDDTSLHCVSIAFQTRTREMHSLLADAPDDVKERLGEILTRALDEIEATLAPVRVATRR
jgi:hypothetical protein